MAPSSADAAAADAPAAAPAEAARTKAHRPPRPDKAVHDKEVADIRVKIEALEKQMNEVKSAISKSGNIKETYDGKRQALRATLDDLAKQRGDINNDRVRILDTIKSAQAGIKKANDETKASKDKLGVNTLEKQQATGTLKINEEKKLIQEISALRAARRTLEALGSSASSVENEKKRIDELRANLDALDPKKKKINDDFDKAKAELNGIESSRRADMDKLNALYDKRKEFKAELDGLYDRLKTARADFKQRNDDWYAFDRAERDRKRAEFQESKKQEALLRLTRAAERELEEAQLPAFQDEIDACNALVAFLQPFTPGGKAANPDAAAATEANPLAATANIRKVDPLPTAGTVLKKKGQRADTDGFMVLSTPKKKGGPGGSAKPSSSSTVDPATPAVARPFKLDLKTMELFFKLGVDVPSGPADAEPAVAAILEKKAKFLADQADQTRKNRERAEAKVAAARAKVEAAGIASVEEALRDLGGDPDDDRDPVSL